MPAAIAAGLQHTGRLLTAAALLDAFLIRTLLLPALMRLTDPRQLAVPHPLRCLPTRLSLRHRVTPATSAWEMSQGGDTITTLM
ncbi:hypothetical protein GCM10009534_34970 [Kribbella sandramycini]|uniref:MMPL family protein n=1 Tax=Kribbella sandramycini TaxID=60450 RepID=A0A841S625_9ACTN|nr:hypothetical protein [Kribbella sandramycini]